MELQKHQPQERALLRNLAAGILPNTKIDITQVSKIEINLELRLLKDDRGVILFEKVLALPMSCRISMIASEDYAKAVGLVAVAITLAMESLNVSRKMNESQIVDLAIAVVEDSGNDSIAIEDLMLFLQRFSRGDYPDLYEGIDQQKFMRQFGLYRDERFEEWKRIRDEKHESYKRLGDDDWGNRNTRTSPIGEELQRHTQRLQQKKDEVALLKRENAELRNQKNN